MPDINIIARISSPFKTKFGVPRQSGVVNEIKAQIVFEPEYRNPDAVRGLEEYSHIWLIWQFSEAVRSTWSPTVRPPRLGGNVHVGVFATRSPFRPNSIGLSSVELEKIEYTADRGPVLHIKGADLMDGTPIFDIKPYIPYADSHPEASGGFTDKTVFHTLRVQIPECFASLMPSDSLEALRGVLANDPRPQYHADPDRVYGFVFADFEVKFKVCEDELTVIDIKKAEAWAAYHRDLQP